VLSMRNKVNRLEEIFMRLIEKNGYNGMNPAASAAAPPARAQGGRS
jgi:hypothetical protein